MCRTSDARTSTTPAASAAYEYRVAGWKSKKNPNRRSQRETVQRLQGFGDGVRLNGGRRVARDLPKDSVVLWCRSLVAKVSVFHSHDSGYEASEIKKCACWCGHSAFYTSRTVHFHPAKKAHREQAILQDATSEAARLDR